MLVYSAHLPEINRIAKTKYGQLRGAWGDTQTITVFKGVPYAKPPIGPLRWQAPQEPDCWEGIRDAREFSGRSWQPEDTDPNAFYRKEFRANPVQNTEDCLYLNIWTPEVKPGAGYPVMFWVHGGALHGGYGFEASFDGEAFCRKGVILVTINYRLGLLGFYASSQLSQESPDHVSGNYGYLDQIAALKWVKENIYNFGGDPENITVFGQSAGAGSVMNLVTSPLSRHLMRKAILQSGVFLFKFGSPGGIGMGFSNTPDIRSMEALGDEFMASLGCSSLEEIRKLSPETLFTAPGTGFGGKFNFGPCVDGYVMEEEPALAFRNGHYADIPYMVGANADENELTSLAKSPEEFLAQAQMTFGADTQRFLDALKMEIRTPKDVKEALKKLDVMRTGSQVFAQMQSLKNRKDTWVYYFCRKLPGDTKGSFHSAELWYVFNTLRRCWRPMTPQDVSLADAMNTYWANFAKNGHPNGGGLLEWPAWKDKDPKEMYFNENSYMEKAQLSSVREFILNYITEGEQI